MTIARKIWHLKVAAAAGAQFPGYQPNQREARPLAEIERPEKLLLGMLESRVDRIHRGKRHWRTSRSQDSVVKKVPPERIWVNRNSGGLFISQRLYRIEL
jgi:methionine synthase II (cobalamin-independent)